VVATRAGGIRGRTALEWGLVDELAPRSRLAEVVASRAAAMAASSDRPASGPGVTLSPLDRQIDGDRIAYRYVTAILDGQRRLVDITITGPPASEGQPTTGDQWLAAGDASWALATVRELDDLILHLRTNELELGTWVLRTRGDARRVLDHDLLLFDNYDDWLVNEIVHYLKRTLKRLDVTSRSLIALIEPGSCFAGVLLELALAADRQYILDGPPIDDENSDERASITLSPANFGAFPMGNGLSRLESRFYRDDEHVERRCFRQQAGALVRGQGSQRFAHHVYPPGSRERFSK